LVAALIASIGRIYSGCVPWRPVLKQVPPWRSQKLATAFDPNPSQGISPLALTGMILE
jgi:hypothetical protein